MLKKLIGGRLVSGSSSREAANTNISRTFTALSFRAQRAAEDTLPWQHSNRDHRQHEEEDDGFC